MQPENLEARVTALEGQVHELRGQMRSSLRDAAAARMLAGAADRDVGEIRGEVRDFRRATVASLNALHEDITGLDGKFNGLRREMNDGFMEMRAKFDITAAGQHRIVELIQRVIDAHGGTAPA